MDDQLSEDEERGRLAYEDEVRSLRVRAEEMLAAGLDDERIAREVHAERDRLKVKYRQLMRAAGMDRRVDEIEARNIERYGNPLGPAIAHLRERGTTWRGIIDSATRTGGEDLGYGQGVKP